MAIGDRQSRGTSWAIVAKIREPDKCASFFQEIEVSWSETHGECKDGVLQPPTLEGIAVGPYMYMKFSACP